MLVKFLASTSKARYPSANYRARQKGYHPLTATPFTPPPIPVHLAEFPTIGGLVVPYTTLRHRNGNAALGLVDGVRVEHCLHEQRCGVCAGVISGRMVFLVRAVDLVRKCSTEPALCPPCAAYTIKACPMVRGFMEHYRKTVPSFVSRQCGDERCPCWAWAPPNPSTARYGDTADKWYALWTLQYQVNHDQDGRLVADFTGLRVLALKEVRATVNAQTERQASMTTHDAEADRLIATKEPHRRDRL
jgi:hypothetical protein